MNFRTIINHPARATHAQDAQHPRARRGFRCTLKAVFPILMSVMMSAMVVGALSGAELPLRGEVLGIVRRSASAEVARHTDSGPSGNAIGNAWTAATFFTGAVKLVDEVDAPDILEFCLKTAGQLNYAHRGGWAPIHLINADDMAIGDLYQAVYLRTGWVGALLPLKQRLDYTLPYLKREPEPSRLVWWWCDALFMAPPVWARMTAITGDRSYIDAMDVQWWRVHERLYDRQERLFSRDARFIERHSENGRKIFWSRGQGWVLAGLCRVLELMPADYPSRSRYITLFREMAERIASLQHPDGLWRASLLDPETFPEPETSGTALFTYALAFGVNHGLLERDAYLPHVLKGWAGLNRFVLPDGILGQVQTTGDQPVPTKRESTALYATGAFILAGLEVARLAESAGKPTSLPLPAKKAPQLKYEAANWGPRKLPASPTPEQLKEYERNEAERRAVADQSFDPMTDDPGFVPLILYPVSKIPVP
jgi:rhamnogalacturonyl hydrolase YesR